MQKLMKFRRNTWLPLLMPYWWRWIIGIALTGGIAIGVWIWVYTLNLRGL